MSREKARRNRLCIRDLLDFGDLAHQIEGTQIYVDIVYWHAYLYFREYLYVPNST